MPVRRDGAISRVPTGALNPRGRFLFVFDKETRALSKSPKDLASEKKLEVDYEKNDN